MPRTDLQVTLDGVPIQPGLALGSWMAFHEHDRFEVSLDGRALFAAADRIFSDAGRLGIWTKADSLPHLDAFEAQTME